jgi:hypothetical protein
METGRAAPWQSSQGVSYALAMYWLCTPRLIGSTSECIASTAVAPRESIGVTYGLRLQPGPASPHCAAPALQRAGSLALACRTPSAEPQLSQSGTTTVPGWHSSSILGTPTRRVPVVSRSLSLNQSWSGARPPPNLVEAGTAAPWLSSLTAAYLPPICCLSAPMNTWEFMGAERQ